MAKRAADTMLGVDIHFTDKAPVYRQLYFAIKRAILDGQLRPGARLPSTRSMGEDLGMSRTTVLNAFDQLTAEGYLQGKVGSGTRVASNVSGNWRLPQKQVDPTARRRKPRFSRRAGFRPVAETALFRAEVRPLRPGQPDLSLFPLELWSRLAAKHWRRAPRDPDHIDSLGYRLLRQAICELVRKVRGIRCEPDQVLIVAGAQQALFLCAQALLDPGESVWMEDPGYPRARSAFLGAGLTVVPVPVDSEGLVVAKGKKKDSSARLVYVTPSFQCPLGCMMSLGRRFELLRFAEQSDAWIVEDDYFNEYRYGSRPVASLQSIDRADRVIYVGNFSKSVAPSLRIGYLVLPPKLIDTFRKIRAAVSRQPPGVDQAVLAEFIAAGHFERHIRRTLRVYRERQQALVDAIQADGCGVLNTSPTGTGTYLVAWLNPNVDEQAAVRAAADHGVDVVPLSTFSIQPLRDSGLVLGYSNYELDRIRGAVKQLCAALSRLPKTGRVRKRV